MAIMRSMTSSPMTMPATRLIHKNESGPVNQVIFATTQLSEDYLIIMSSAAKATNLQRDFMRSSYFDFIKNLDLQWTLFSERNTVVGA